MFSKRVCARCDEWGGEASSRRDATRRIRRGHGGIVFQANGGSIPAGPPASGLPFPAQGIEVRGRLVRLLGNTLVRQRGRGGLQFVLHVLHFRLFHTVRWTPSDEAE